ncbi:MAG: FHA domain-containing protein [bacterium]|nr:FHA domain-containing protein [bacterium]
MSMYDAAPSGRNVRSRRCARCSHINPASYLVCRECNTILSHSEWVDIPAMPSPPLPDTKPASASRLKRVSLQMSDRSADETTPSRPSFFRKRETTALGKNKPASPPVDDEIQAAAEEGVSAPREEYRETLTMPRVQLDEESGWASDAAGYEVPSAWQNVPNVKEGTSVFESTMMLCIEVTKASTPIVLRLPQQRALVFGRDDVDTKERPDIDLIPYGGYNMGISRRHAALELIGKRLSIRDLKSSNGTYLNGVRLDAYEPHQLRDGDQVRLGSLVLRVFFRQ